MVQRKKVLMISPILPDPNRTGAHRRAAAHLSALSELCDVYLLIYTSLKGEPCVPEGTMRACMGIETIPVDPVTQSELAQKVPGATLLLDMIRPDRFWGLPDLRKMADALQRFGVPRFDTLFAFRLRSALAVTVYQAARGGISDQQIVDFDDIESIKLKRFLKSASNNDGTEWTLVHRLRAARIRRLEDRTMKKFDATLVCSDEDRDTLVGRCPGSVVAVIPNTVDLIDASEEETSVGHVNLLFVGTMSYPPNIDAVTWFVSEIFPLIERRSELVCKLSIVGFDPTPEIKALASDRVEITGAVESVTPYYQRSHLVVAPIRFGGGTRIKILEAMSAGRAVVATTIGAEGISVQDGVDLVLADRAEDFASACVRLLEANSLRRSIAEAGRRTVKEKYTLAATRGEYRKLVGVE
ncbi:MAG: glycosyltransferase [Alphaproteobacteria bacterium]